MNKVIGFGLDTVKLHLASIVFDLGLSENPAVGGSVNNIQLNHLAL